MHALDSFNRHAALRRGRFVRTTVCSMALGFAGHASAQTSPGANPVAEQTRNIRDLLSNPGIEAEAKRQQERNALIAGSIKAEEFTKSSGFDAKLGEVFGSIRNGTHNVVSPDGEEIVTLIRSLATAVAPARDTALRALKSYADKSAPEALNFIGFATEYGLFGLRPDIGRARSFYLAAGKARYQPALYNTGLALAYGRGGRVDLARAAALLEIAAAVAPDPSARVCGLGAFVDDRRNAQAGALAFAKGCASPLATVPRARAQRGPLTPQTLDELRKSTATGIDDGYGLIEQAARVAPVGGNPDSQFLYCKYALVNRYRALPKSDAMWAQLHDNAAACYDQTAKVSAADAADRGAASMRREQAIGAVTGFVPAEIAALAAMRKSNRFHYGWSVPYLPFTQQDADLFEPLMGH